MIMYGIYFILPIFLALYFEILGTVIINKFRINILTFNGIVGFAFFLFIFQLLSLPIALFQLNFTWLMFIFALSAIGSLYLIIKNKKLIHSDKSIKDCISVIAVVAIIIFFALQNTIGDVMSYDTVSYVNLISGNIYGDGIGTLGMSNGYTSTPGGYILQAYYLLASCLYFIVNGFCNLFGIDFFYFTQHTWMYSVLLYIFMGEGVVNIYKRINKNILAKSLIFIFFILFMGNFYWNSEQAYLGISYKMILVSYSCYYLYEYFNNNKLNNLIVSMAFLMANISCANCNSTLAIIFIFGIWLINKNNNESLLVLGLSILMPIFFLLYQLSNKNILLSILPLIVILMVLKFFRKEMLNLEQKRIKTLIAIIVAAILIIGSIIVSPNYFAFDGFLNNMSGNRDMTWGYTDFSSSWRLLANAIYILVMFSCVYVNRKNKFVICVSIIALIFFNPFAADLQNKYMIVFYRNYDIFVNYFTLTLGIVSLYKLITNRKIYYSLCCVLIITSLYISINQILYHPAGQKWNITNEKGGYNRILRMYNDEAETLRFVKSYMADKENKDLKVISSIYEIRCELPRFKTLFNRNNAFNGIESEYELFKIFFNEEYYGDKYTPGKGDYANMCKSAGDAMYDLIIQKKDKLYYDEKTDNYYSIKYLIDKCGKLPIYENDSFAVYAYGS